MFQAADHDQVICGNLDRFAVGAAFQDVFLKCCSCNLRELADAWTTLPGQPVTGLRLQFQGIGAGLKGIGLKSGRGK